MPTPPDFTAGTALAAASLNKIGLWEVTSATIGSNVATVVVANCFSSAYENYRIIVSNSICNVNDYGYGIVLNNSTGSTYNMMSYYGDFASTAAGPTRYQNSPYGLYLGFSSATNTSFIVDVMSPYLATWTKSTHSAAGTNYAIFGASIDKNAVSHTGFTLKSDDPTPRLTGGTITVYGFGKV